MRSPAASASRRRVSSFIRSRRLGRSSGASIESDASRTSTTSMPLACCTVVSIPQRGPASATAPQRGRERRAATARSQGARIAAGGMRRATTIGGAQALRAARRRRWNASQSSSATAAREGRARAKSAQGYSTMRAHGSGPRQQRSSDLERERRERGAERPAELLGEVDVRARAHRLALEEVDLLVDALERRGVDARGSTGRPSSARRRAAAPRRSRTGRYS